MVSVTNGMCYCVFDLFVRMFDAFFCVGKCYSSFGNCFLLSFVTKKVFEEAKFLPFFGLLDMLFFRTKRFQA